MNSHSARSTTDIFPFYRIDEESWQKIAGQSLYDVWPETEDHLIRTLAGDQVELLQMLALDRNMNLTHSRIIAVGTIDHLYARIRYVAEQALGMDAYGVVLAHNHTSGNPQPSWDDVAYTHALHHAFQRLDITLLDHLIIGFDRLFSLRRHNMLF